MSRTSKLASSPNRISEEGNGQTAQVPGKREVVTVQRPDLRTIQVRIVGDTPLIAHAWDAKAIREMEDRQTGKASMGREKKNPQEDYESSLYRLADGGYGFPCSAFKKAAKEACTSLGRSITKSKVKQAFHVIGHLVRIEGEPLMRRDVVRVGNFKDVADLRYRAEFPVWSVVLTIKYNARVMSAEEIINLLEIAGFAVGVGEWRPERDGQFGMFHVEPV
jgi:hypothetical protein